MQDGKALKNTLYYSEDFGGDRGERGTTMSRTGEPIMVEVYKCPQCGYSVEKGKKAEELLKEFEDER